METCYKDNIIDLYKAILEQETSNHNTFIWVLLGITTVLLGVTWWWNKAGANRYIKSTINKELKKVKIEIENLVEEKVKERLVEKSEQIDKEFTSVKADISRTFAYTLFTAEDYSHCVFWSAQSIKYFIKLNDGKLIRASANVMLDAFDNMDKKKEVHSKDEVNKIIELLPATLSTEKKKIFKLIEESKDV